MLFFRVLRRFSEMKYYKQMASFLKIKVPIINQDIQIQENRTCLIHGLKKIEVQPNLAIQGQVATTLEVEKIKLAQALQNNQKKDISQAVLGMPQSLYIYDKYSKQSIPFSKAIQISKMLKMDVSLMRYGPQGSQPTLTLTTFRKNVYTQYYTKYIKRRGTSGFKNIRLGQKIQDNDIKTKKANIQRMLKQGQRRFKLMAQNDSDRSQKVIIQFAKFFEKEVEPYITTVKSSRGKMQQKWSANLIFDDQLQINIDQINKKWKRKCYQQSRQQKTQEEEQQQLQKLFSDDDVRMERQMYHAYKQLDMKMPKRFQKMADQQKMFGSDKMALYRSVLEAEKEGDLSQEWDDDEQQNFKSKMQMSNKQYFGERSATQIIQQMQALKKSGYESEAHKVARFRQLKQQLKNIIKKSQKTQL